MLHGSRAGAVKSLLQSCTESGRIDGSGDNAEHAQHGKIDILHRIDDSDVLSVMEIGGIGEGRHFQQQHRRMICVS